MNKNNWQQRVRTGGIRRKILKEYLQIIKPINKLNQQYLNNYGSVQNTEKEVPEAETVTQVQTLFINSTNSVQNIEETEGDICSSESEYEYKFKKQETFRESIKIWALKNKITHVALNEVSVIINELIPGILPRDSRTVLRTPKEITIKNIEGGQYWHNGVAKPLQKILENWIDAPDIISLNINVDGLPIFKSSSNEFWPILCNIFENPKIRPFVVGIYFGKGKPRNVNDFFEDFVHEMNILLEEGLHVQPLEKKVKIKIRCFICDSPARAYIKG